MFKTFFLTAALLLSPLTVLAHAEGVGQTVGDYKIEFSTLPEEPIVGTQQSLLIGVEDAETFEPIAGVPVWVRISQGDYVLFSSSDFVSNDEQLITVSFLPQTAGDYTVDIQLENPDGEKLDPVEFAVVVEGESLLEATAESDAVVDENTVEDAPSSVERFILIFFFIVIVVLLAALMRRRH